MALDKIVRAAGPRLVRVALRCCRSSHDAEDAVQIAMLEASKTMTTYRGEGDPVAWLSTLVARSCYRLNGHRHPQVDDVEAVCRCADPEVALEEKRLGSLLSVTLMELSRTDRLMVVLASEGWRGPEIAEQFGMTPDAVRSRLKRARKTLRDQLSDSLGR